MITHTLTVEVDRSQIITSNNERGHWAKRSGIKRTMRHKAELLARAARLPRGLERVHAVVHVDYPDRRARDVANLYPTIKCHVDGIVGDYGLAVNDSDAHFVGPDMRVSGRVVSGKYRFHYRFVDLSKGEGNGETQS